MTLLAAYNFDEASGAVVDVTGNGHGFTPTGQTVRTAAAAGHTNKGLSQTANSDDDGPALFGESASRTLMMWVKTTADFTGWAFEWHHVSLDTGMWGLLCLSGQLGFRGRNAGGTPAHASVARPTDNAWHHFAGTYDGTNVRLYVDGTLSATVALSGGIAAATATAVNAFNTSTMGNQTVIIDDVRVYDVALSQAQVASDMATPVSAGASFSGSVALTGSGALVNAGTPGHKGTVGLSGSGSLARAGTPAVAGTVTLAGAGQLAGAGRPAVVGGLGLSGSGTASDTGSPAVSGITALAGTGALTSTGSPGHTGTTALAGAGSMTAAGQPMLPGNLSLSGGGQLLGASGNDYSGAATLAGSGTLALTGKPAITGALNLTGAGRLALAKAGSMGPATQSVLTASNAPSSALTPYPRPVLTPSNAPSSHLEVSHGV